MLKTKSPRCGYPYPVRPGLHLERLRLVERIERGVQPVWKLYGPGSVGGQCLVGIAAVGALRDDPLLSEHSRVWPFETGFTGRPTPDKGPFVLHVEIWPGVVPDSPDDTISIRDQAQVRAMVSWLSAFDEAGKLGILFDTPYGLPPEALALCLNEEGWIIGIGRKQR